MESLKLHLFLAFVLIAYTILLSHPAFSSHEYDLMDGINKYRQSLKLNLSDLPESPQAKCLAVKLSDQLKNVPCDASTTTKYWKLAIPANNSWQSQPFTGHHNVLLDCNIGVHHATDAVVLPACVPNPYPTTWILGNYTNLIVTNYTTQYASYLNDSNFTGFGAECQHDWMVVVLSTDAEEGNLASAAVGLVLETRLGAYLVALLLGVVSLVLTS